MSDMQESPVPAGQVGSSADGVKLVYILYFIGFVTALTALAGVIVAYMKRDEAGPVAASHYQYQIRTFWIGVLYLVAGAVLSFIMIGFAIFLWWLVWTLVRCIKGFLLIGDGKPVPEPGTWLW